MAEIIRTLQLSKRYHPPHGPLAVDAVDLEIAEGEVLSLLGPNGAGKSTLIALLCGLLPPTGGQAWVGGHDVQKEPLAVRRLLGVVPEEAALYPQLTGRGNLHYFGGLYGLGGQELNQAVADALAVVDLTERANERVSRYSAGMRRRLNIAVGLVHRPRIVLMDEPSMGLDLESRRRIQDLVLRLNKDQGTTILYCTHHMEEAEAVSDRVAIMHQGKIIALGPAHELIAAHLAGKTVRLRLGKGLISSGTLAAWRGIRGIERVSWEGDTVSLALSGAAEPLVEILGIATQRSLTVRSLTVERPNLEGVFLRLTGRGLSETP